MVRVTGKDHDRKYKLLSLIVLVLQSSSLVLLMRYTRSIAPKEELYMPSTAVLFSEIIKLIVCTITYIFLYNKEHKIRVINMTALSLSLTALHEECWKIDGMKLIIPAGLYALQNNLLYIALSNLDAATYQVTYQLKVLTTAIFSVVMLKRVLNVQQWICLVLLMLGVALVQLDQADSFTNNEDADVSSSELDQSDSEVIVKASSFIGFVAILFSCFTSGFAGVYFERVLKGSATSLWVRNIQLSTFGAFFSLILMLLNDVHTINELGIFFGYNGYVVLVIFNQALGGLVVALVVRYSNQILKGFAMSIAVLISCTISVFLFDFNPSMKFAVGAVMVISSVVMYAYCGPSNVNPKERVTFAGDKKKDKREEV